MIDRLPPREREVFDALYALGEATAVEVTAALDDAPSNSAIRVMLSRLENKGVIRHRVENNRFVYAPAVAAPKIQRSAVQRFVQTYFKGSPVSAAAALIGMSEKVSSEDLDQLEQLIAKARQEGVR